MWSSASALLLCLNCQRYEVQFPHFCSARIFKGPKLCFRNSALSLLPKIWSSAFHTSARPGLRRSRSSPALLLPGLWNMGKSTSAFHLCRDYQRCDVPLPHFCSALTAKGLKFRFLYYRSTRTSKDLVHLPHLFCQDFQVWVNPLPHFISAKRCEISLQHFCSVLTANDTKISFRNSALPGLLKFQSFDFAIPLCLYCQKSKVPLSILPLGQDFEDLVHLPHLLCQDFQIR